MIKITKSLVPIFCLIFPMGLLQQAASQTTQQACKAIPYNFITPCDIKCTSCSSTGGRDECDSCPSYFQHDSDSRECEVPAGRTYHISKYFQNEKVANTTDLQKFTTQNGLLTDDQITTFCIANNYRFDYVGLLTSTTYITHKETYDLDIDSISIRFRLFSRTESFRIKVQINNIVEYDQFFQSGSEVFTNHSFVRGQPSLFLVESDPTTYLDKVFVPISTGLISMEGKQGKEFEITISVSSSSSTIQQFWGISEVMFVARQCNICVTEATKLLQRVLGIIIGITAGIVIVLMIALLVVNTIKEKNQKRKMKSRIEAMLKDKMEHNKKMVEAKEKKEQEDNKQISDNIK